MYSWLKSGLLTLTFSSCIGWYNIARVSCVLVVCIHSGLFALVVALAFFMAWLFGMSLALICGRYVGLTPCGFPWLSFSSRRFSGSQGNTTKRVL